jgi:orotidine-5'-phosphate decarboxylase
MKPALELIRNAQTKNRSWLCVGLDPVASRFPQSVLETQRPALTFCREIVEATSDLVCAYKPNLAFWLLEGPDGLASLQELIASIPPHIPVILDAKSGDVGHTAEAYARMTFDTLGAHACTANPYLGGDSLRPFLERDGTLVFVLARTSNSSAPEVQDLTVRSSNGGSGADCTLLFEQVATLAASWDARWPGAVGLVVGATYPNELKRLRALAPDLPFLIPGVGAQGGDLEAAVTAGPTAGDVGPVINSSRGILYAWQACLSAADYAEAARLSAVSLRNRINEAILETNHQE